MVVVDIVKNVIIDGVVVVVLFDLFHEVSFDFMLNFNLGIIPVAQQEFVALCPGLGTEISVWQGCPKFVVSWFGERNFSRVFLLCNRNLLCPGLRTEISVWQGCPEFVVSCWFGDRNFSLVFLLGNRNLLCPGLGTEISVWQGCPVTKENCSC
jgi:hypothetical protein